MIDLVILLALVVVFYAGFRCGKTFGTVGAMWKAILKKLGADEQSGTN